MEQTDNFRHKGLRKKLIDSIRSKGVKNEDVLEAMGRVPRHLFMDSSFVNFSYTDKAFPIAAGQTISQPYTVAFQTELLEVKKHLKVLEIGTGSGYQTAVLLELGSRVYTIERQRELFLDAQKTLGPLNYKPNFFYGDGYEGLPSYQPFDRILITAAAPEIPQTLLDQLAIGGILVVPEGDKFGQKMVRVVRESEDHFQRSEHGHFSFVPLLRGKNQ
ncbi:MAG: protein-L-isoaspartate O-methyltransferase [Bacteroidetes bacterium]|nr:MAG: protein-L-isoaspartate O-methyltransferase [Bacteroidota bacterium]RLD71663.1 MAG: protein-L-isoaspartate O-methyltransferase [Bacteroidota bacterium]RLD93194.1 MAG: protein-L-isoaspartate O-methyltransferase [Bacteroidota bacterium]RLE06144.1 MAG: protein-L-isoaspartate O-methyltransferase [Bacteroidota bacterium]